MRMVSPTLRVSVSTCTPPWVLASVAYPAGTGKVARNARSHP
jgi:hypothetical protein